MKCPTCGAIDTRVVDSRPAEEATILRRRRHCDGCGGRFTTHERLVEAPLLIVKKDGRREEFQPAKLRGGLLKACNKRPVSSDQIDHLIDAVEKSLRSEAKGEVNAELIGERVMEQLIQLDQVAYVRFASVYQRFDDVRRFAQLLERMSRRKRSRSQGSQEKSDAAKEVSPSAAPSKS